MKFHARVIFAVAAFVPVLHAGPTDVAIVAATNLADAPNYGWVSDIADDARSYIIDGKTNLVTPGDYSLVNLPVNFPGRGRGPGARGANASQTAIFKGDEKLVVQVGDNWKNPDEMNAGSARGGMPGRGRFGGRGMRGARGGFPGKSDSGDSPAPAGYSNLQLTLSRPHEELAIIVANYVDLSAADDVVSGSLSETGAKLLLVHAGQKDITPLHASGTFRLWVRDGVLTKYEVKLEGTLAVTGRGDRQEVNVHQTAVTQIREVGTTTFEVPDEARKKLGA